MALNIPDVRFKRQVRLVYRKVGHRSHAATSFLALFTPATAPKRGKAVATTQPRQAQVHAPATER